MTLFVKIDSWCVFVNMVGVTVVHSFMATYVCVCVWMCVNRVHEDVAQHEICFINGSEAFRSQAWISWLLRRQGLFLYLSLSQSISLAPSLLAGLQTISALITMTQARQLNFLLL